MTSSCTSDDVISLLYVEDDRASREMFREILTSLFRNIRIFVATNGKEGLESFKLNRQEVVITDINMPVTDGLKMASWIKALSPSTEIIAVTAYTNTDYLLQAIDIGISHYILKPVDVEHLTTIINKVLGTILAKRQIARQNEEIRILNSGLAAKAAELDLKNRELESFAYTVAHDLRSPLIAVGKMSEILLDTPDSMSEDAGRNYLQLINREVSTMNRLVSALLKFSVDANRPVTKKWESLSGIAQEIKVSLLARNPSRHVTFTIADDVNGFCDPDLVRIVLENLLENAFKYSATKSGAWIEFGTLQTEEDLVYLVRDNGTGFDQTQAEKLFAPFQRLESDEKFAGFGIGLATTSRIINRHGGKIWAEGVPGKGATFFFTL